MRKIGLIIVISIFVLGFMCSCTPKETGGIGSNNAESEIVLSSTVETSSVSESEPEKESSSSKKESSSSKKEESSSKKEESSSKKEESSSKNESNSSRPSMSVQRPGSTTNSQGIKVAPANRNSVFLRGFDKDAADSYGSHDEDGYREMQDIISAGYVNSISHTYLLRETQFWNFVIANDLTVWYDATTLFDSSAKTLDSYLEYIYKTVDQHIFPHPDRWERFNGFIFDEKIRRGESCEEFVTETQALYRKYGKRTFAILATGEFSDIDGNDGGAKQMNKVGEDTLRYVTDVVFDSSKIDVRDGEHNADVKEKYQQLLPDVVDGKSYYRELTDLLIETVDHAVNIWFMPCAYNGITESNADGLERADEEFCLAQLNFFYEELSNYDNTGGLMIYSYDLSSRDESKGLRGLKYRLVVENDEEGEEQYKIHPEAEKWIKYSERLKEIVYKFNTKKASIVTKVY